MGFLTILTTFEMKSERESQQEIRDNILHKKRALRNGYRLIGIGIGDPSLNLRRSFTFAQMAKVKAYADKGIQR